MRAGLEDAVHALAARSGAPHRLWRRCEEPVGACPCLSHVMGYWTTLAVAKSAAGIGTRRRQVIAMGRSPRCST